MALRRAQQVSVDLGKDARFVYLSACAHEAFLIHLSKTWGRKFKKPIPTRKKLSPNQEFIKNLELESWSRMPVYFFFIGYIISAVKSVITSRRDQGHNKTAHPVGTE